MITAFWLPLIIALCSAGGMWLTAHFSFQTASAVISFITAVVFISAAQQVCRDAQAEAEPDQPQSEIQATLASLAQSNARLLAVAFLWGAVVLGAGYGLTELNWQHWWQYALAMALLAAICAWVTRATDPRGGQLSGSAGLDLLSWLTTSQAIAAATGLAILFINGKSLFDRPDWLANQVFAFGGAAIVVISIHAVLAHRAIRSRIDHPG